MAQFEVTGSPPSTEGEPPEIEEEKEEHKKEKEGEPTDRSSVVKVQGKDGETQSSTTPAPNAPTSGSITPSAPASDAPATQSPPSLPTPTGDLSVSEAIGSLKNEIQEIREQCQRTEIAVKQLSGSKGEKPSAGEKHKEGDSEPPENNVELEARLQEIAEQIKNMQGALSQQIENVQEQANEIENGLGLLAERVNVGAGGTDEMPGLRELFKKIGQIETDMSTISNTSAKLMEISEETTAELNSIQEKLELLSDSKADREELDDALQDKADKVALERKVSHENFHDRMADLSEGLHDATIRIQQQEEMWHLALNEFEIEIGRKLDKKEMAPLKQFINKKLKNLHKRLKTLAKLRRAEEAAAAKKDLIKDNNCLSCDADAVMKKYEEILPFPPAPPPHHNIKPFLTYELDMIRNEKKKLPAKNLIRLEDAMSKKKGSQPLTKWVHMCNRYCGGGHTMTTPSQRVTHVGRFGTCVPPGPETTQLARGWGPVPCPSGYGAPRPTYGDPRRQSRRSQAPADNQRKDTYTAMKETVEKMI